MVHKIIRDELCHAIHQYAGKNKITKTITKTKNYHMYWKQSRQISNVSKLPVDNFEWNQMNKTLIKRL